MRQGFGVAISSSRSGSGVDANYKIAAASCKVIIVGANRWRAN